MLIIYKHKIFINVQTMLA